MLTPEVYLGRWTDSGKLISVVTEYPRFNPAWGTRWLAFERPLKSPWVTNVRTSIFPVWHYVYWPWTLSTSKDCPKEQQCTVVEGDWLSTSFANAHGSLSASHFQTLKRNTVGPGCSPSIWTWFQILQCFCSPTTLYSIQTKACPGPRAWEAIYQARPL